MGRTSKPTTVPYRRLRSLNGGASKPANVTAVGRCPAHHGEFVQGKFKTSNQSQRGLITVPCENFYSEARFQLNPRSRKLIVLPATRTKARRAAQLALKECGMHGCGGYLEVRSNIPMRLGMGSSTADVVATINAVGKACGVELPAEVIARLAVLAEKASDSTMFGDRAILMAHREGSVIEYFSGPLPHVIILGTNTDLSGVGVDTLKFQPAEYSDKEVMEFEVLRGMMRRAIETQSAALIGKVASASARINQPFLPKPNFDRLERIVESVGAVGLQVAHSGTVVGLIFEPNDAVVRERLNLAQVRLIELGLQQMWEFEISKQLREVAA